MKTMFKRMTAFAMAAMMMFAMAVSASATGTMKTATFYKNNSTTDTSMANDAVAGSATVTEIDENTVQVSIPLQAVSYLGYTGYISAATINDTITATVTAHPYASGTMVFTISSTAAAAKMDVNFEVQLYDDDGECVGTPHDKFLIAPSTINADLYLS